MIGAHSVPRWYEAMDRLVSSGQLAPGDFIDAQLRATQAAILEQEIAGIDVITGGEMHRRTHNRHSPPNAMLNHFWQKIPAFQGETKPKPITRHDPHVFHPAAICRGPILDSIDLGLAEEFKTVSSFARKPVKVTMTGPHLLAAVAHDDYCGDMHRIMTDFGKLLRQNFKMLVAAGCKHIQIDEPYFTASTEGDVAAAVSVINQMIEDIPEDVHVGVHICQGAPGQGMGPVFAVCAPRSALVLQSEQTRVLRAQRSATRNQAPPSGRIDRRRRRRGVEHGERPARWCFGFHRRNVAFLPARANALRDEGTIRAG